MVRIALIADYNSASETHLATQASLGHASDLLGIPVEAQWIATENISDAVIKRFDAMVIGTGVYKNRTKVLSALQFGRERGLPTLGICGGFQHMMIEYARSVLGVAEPAHAEFDPPGRTYFIVPLPCSLRGREMEINLIPNTQVSKLYGATKIVERYYCSFGVNPEFLDKIGRSAIKIVGSDSEGVLRITELPGHPFFVGTLFVPQVMSTEEHAHPLIKGLVSAAARGKA